MKFRKKWEQEDAKIPMEERTKVIIAMTMTGIEDYLEFTAESGMMAGSQLWMRA